jgi:signal transduction histidine kinase
VHLGIKAKQIAGVSLIVGLAVVALSLLHITFVAHVLLEESRLRGELLANTIFQRAKDVVVGQADPWAAITADGGLRAILQSSAFAPNVTYAAICNLDDVAVAAWDPSREGKRLAPVGELESLTRTRGLKQLIGVYSAGARTLEVRQPILLGVEKFGTIRVGVSTDLIRGELTGELRLVGAASLVALLIAVVVSASFARLILRPIHVIRSGLTRLGRGEFGVRLDLPQQDEFGELGSFFNTVSERLSADRSQLAGQPAGVPTAAERAEDEAALLNYSRKLVALGRLTAGVAHEVKNPLNAMTIHLELLKQKLLAVGGAGRRRQAGADGAHAAAPSGAPPDVAPALEHVRIIGGEIQRLDQVMQGLLKFTRPEDLKLQALSLTSLVDEVVRVIRPECEAAKVDVVVEGLGRALLIMGDSTMLRQALLNLALNARQAMPNGGTLRISAVASKAGRVEILVEDTGVGIKPEHLGRIFDLYFTTREKGSGIGLSMVYRTVQLHDGDIEVQSTEGRGTTFRISLPQGVPAPAGAV